MRAYDESYLSDAMDTLGEMLDYAVIDCGYDADEFFGWFTSSGIAGQFERGNPKFVAGMSGIELAQEVVFRTTGRRELHPATQPLDRSPEYWAGWILAYYQWYRTLRFADIADGGLPPSAVLSRYILHEADVTKFVETADRVLASQCERPTSLASIRRNRGMTQQELSDAAGVSLRMVQLYEQRQNDLAKASVSVVLALAHVLGCEPEDLLEGQVLCC